MEAKQAATGKLLWPWQEIITKSNTSFGVWKEMIELVDSQGGDAYES